MIIKAAVLKNLSEPLVIEELEVPELGIGQVLVKVMVSGICGKQLGEISGHYGPDKYLPHLLGHEGGGIVVNVGPGVTQVKPGDHVVMHWRKGAGIEAASVKYHRADSSTVGGGPVHTFCEYAVVSENRVTAIPKDVPFKIAALMGCAVTTAFGLISNEAQVKIGQSVAVIGCGGVGMAIIQAAKLAGAYPIYAIDRYESKIEIGRLFGASRVAISSTDGLDDVVEKKYDVVLETTGNSNLINTAYFLTQNNGKTILVGQPRYDQTIDLSDVMTGKQLFASQGGLTNPTTDIPRYIRMYQAGKLEIDKLISHTLDFADINKALDTARSGEAIRVMVKMA